MTNGLQPQRVVRVLRTTVSTKCFRKHFIQAIAVQDSNKDLISLSLFPSTRKLIWRWQGSSSMRSKMLILWTQKVTSIWIALLIKSSGQEGIWISFRWINQEDSKPGQLLAMGLIKNNRLLLLITSKFMRRFRKRLKWKIIVRQGKLILMIPSLVVVVHLRHLWIAEKSKGYHFYRIKLLLKSSTSKKPTN